MNRIHPATGFAFPGEASFASPARRFTWPSLSRAQNHCLDYMPRERLEDMGIPPRTEANFRTSGEAGPLPRGEP
jgi:hypothetical protein